MRKTISIFNNKGGVGKTSLCWNVADALARKDKKVLLIDFDPQCNLSIAVLGEDTFVNILPTVNQPYGATIRAFLQRFLQNTGGEEVFTHKGRHTHQNVDLVAGDFWLNVYAESLNVGADLLSGTGLSRFVVLDTLIDKVQQANDTQYDYVLIDLPPSFGSLVRAAFYSSDYFVVPCTSDNFSVYCVGLIGQMVPNFIQDWDSGLSRFKGSNPNFTDFDTLGMPKFGGWIFNGFDTSRERRTSQEIATGVPQKEKVMVRADRTFHERIQSAITNDLVNILNARITRYHPVSNAFNGDFQIGATEDANVLIQNSLWQNVPISQLDQFQQVTTLQDRINWASNQIEQIHLLRDAFNEIAEKIIVNCN
jgi:chromosome partitioning protein